MVQRIKIILSAGCGVDLLQVDLHEKNKREKNASERERQSREREGGRLVKLAGFHLHFAPKLSSKFSY